MLGIADYGAFCASILLFLMLPGPGTFALLTSTVLIAQDNTRFEADTLKHFQALVRLNTSNPPGNEMIAADYLVAALTAANIPVQTFARDRNRPNVVARLKGNGRAHSAHGAHRCRHG
jgi:hypothetical protein